MATREYHPHQESQEEKYIPKYYPDATESMMRTSGPAQGWKYGMIAVDAIRRVVEKVGAENVDGAAIRDALLETDITVEGWGSPWRCTEDSHFFAGAQRMYEWIPAEEKWVVASGWYTPPLAVLD